MFYLSFEGNCSQMQLVASFGELDERKLKPNTPNFWADAAEFSDNMKKVNKASFGQKKIYQPKKKTIQEFIEETKHELQA